MSKLSTRMSNEIANVVERKFQGFLNVNKYDLFKEARTATGEFVRYRDVRDEIDNIIFNVADKLELDLEKYFVRNADGKVYVEYIPYEHEVADDDSDICDETEIIESVPDNSEPGDNIYYTRIDSQGRIYIPLNIRKIFNIDKYYLYVLRDYDRRKIILNTEANYNSVINLGDRAQISVANPLNLSEGDKVRIHNAKDGTVIIDPA